MAHHHRAKCNIDVAEQDKLENIVSNCSDPLDHIRITQEVVCSFINTLDTRWEIIKTHG